MTLHVGELTSEVVAASGPAEPGSPADGEMSVWEERHRLLCTLERLAAERARTATGHDDD